MCENVRKWSAVSASWRRFRSVKRKWLKASRDLVCFAMKIAQENLLWRFFTFFWQLLSTFEIISGRRISLLLCWLFRVLQECENNFEASLMFLELPKIAELAFVTWKFARTISLRCKMKNVYISAHLSAQNSWIILNKNFICLERVGNIGKH